MAKGEEEGRPWGSLRAWAPMTVSQCSWAGLQAPCQDEFWDLEPCSVCSAVASGGCGLANGPLLPRSMAPQEACMTPGHDCGPCSRGPRLQGSPSFSRPASFPETPRVVSSSQSGTEKSQSYRQSSGSFSVPGSSGGSFAWYKPSPDRYVGGCPGPGSRPLNQPAFPSRGFSLSKVLPTGSKDAGFVPEKQESAWLRGWGASLLRSSLHPTPVPVPGLREGRLSFQEAVRGRAGTDLATPPGRGANQEMQRAELPAVSFVILGCLGGSRFLPELFALGSSKGLRW